MRIIRHLLLSVALAVLLGAIALPTSGHSGLVLL